MDLKKYKKELSEVCGVHVGDGYLRNDGMRREWDISGSVEEKEYYDKYLIPLFNRIFKTKIEGRFFKGRNTYGFVIREKKIVEFAHDVLGFPYGKKSQIISIPKFILNDKGLLKYFLRGYIDTDGYVGFTKKKGNYCKFKRTKDYYPRIQFATVSKQLSIELTRVLRFLKFKTMNFIYEPKKETESTQFLIHLNGLTNLNKWLEDIGIKNPTKHSRVLIWEKFGFCPTNISYSQRLKILKGLINPKSFYKGS